MWLTFLNVLSKRGKKKKYTTNEMIFYLTDWELLVDTDPILVLTAAGTPTVSKDVCTCVGGALNVSSN